MDSIKKTLNKGMDKATNVNNERMSSFLSVDSPLSPSYSVIRARVPLLTSFSSRCRYLYHDPSIPFSSRSPAFSISLTSPTSPSKPPCVYIPPVFPSPSIQLKQTSNDKNGKLTKMDAIAQVMNNQSHALNTTSLKSDRHSSLTGGIGQHLAQPQDPSRSIGAEGTTATGVSTNPTPKH